MTCAGVSPRETVRRREVVSLEVSDTSRLILELACGERIEVFTASDVPPQQQGRGLVAEQVIALLMPDRVRYGAVLPPRVRFYRTPRIVCGERVIEYTEAGR